MDRIHIKAKAFAVFRRGREVLVNEVREQDGSLKGYRIPGGHIEFAERSQDAVVREIKEELNQDIENVSLLGVLENIFTHHGQTGHEIVFVYTAEFQDKSIYQQDEVIAFEHTSDHHFKLFWLDPARRPAGTGFWPEGLVELIS